MSINQAAISGLSALMSLGAKSKPVAREDGFKTAMADAQVQHTRATPKPKRETEQKSVAREAKSADSAASASKAVKDEGSEVDQSATKQQASSASAELDKGSAEAHMAQNDPHTDEQASNVVPAEPQDLPQPDGLAGPLGLSIPQFQLAASHNRLGLGVDGVGIAVQPDENPLAALAELEGSTLLASSYLSGGAAGVKDLTRVLGVSEPLAGANMALLSAPQAGQMTVSPQALKAGEGLVNLGLTSAEDATLNLGRELDVDSPVKGQVATAVNDKLLQSPSQKVLAAALMQADADSIKIAQSLDHPAAALKKGSSDAMSSISSTLSTSANSLNGRVQPITVPVSQPHWAQSAGERVVWMVSQKLQSAEIQLDPPELGPLQVKVSVQHDQVSITFVSHSAQVRDALDQHALRLREMFEGQGLDLVDVDVSDQSFQQREEQGDSQPRSGNPQDDDKLDSDVQMIASKVSSQLVDHFV